MTLARNVRQISILAAIASTNFFICLQSAQASQRVCIITDAGVKVCGKLVTPSKPKPISTATREISGFVFTLTGCRRSGSNVSCSLTVVSKNEGKNLSVVAPDSKLVDSAGNTYVSSGANFLDAVDDNSFLGAGGSLSLGIKYALSLNFRDIPEQVQQVQLFHIETREGVVKFLNVAISN
jgi:hypothetical protein